METQRDDSLNTTCRHRETALELKLRLELELVLVLELVLEQGVGVYAQSTYKYSEV